MTATGTTGDRRDRSPRVHRRTFLIAFGVVALLIAGLVSYLASSSPDGLDSTTLRGCETTEVNGAEQLTGDCIAQHATDHVMASSPLADYSFRGIGDTNGIAGVIGVVITLGIAAGMFWIIGGARRERTRVGRSGTGSGD